MTTGLFIATACRPAVGGAEEHAHQVAKHLTELGERMVIIAPSAEGDMEWDRHQPYLTIRYTPASQRVGHNRLVARFRTFLTILSTARQLKPDYILCTYWHPLTGLGLALAFLLMRVPIFLVVHDIEVVKNSGLVPHISRHVTRWYVKRIFCVSQYTRGLMEQAGFELDKLSVILNGLDLHPIDEYLSSHSLQDIPLNSALASANPILLTVGRLSRDKGIDTVIQAMPLIVRRFPKAMYVICGDGNERDMILDLAESSDARDSIAVLGRVSESEKMKYYMHCDVFVMPSRNFSVGSTEGFGLVFLEAHAFGKPVIGSRAGGIPEVALDNENGLLVDPEDPVQIADAVTHLLNEPGLARQFGANGRHRIERELTWERYARELLSSIGPSLGK